MSCLFPSRASFEVVSDTPLTLNPSGCVGRSGVGGGFWGGWFGGGNVGTLAFLSTLTFISEITFVISATSDWSFFNCLSSSGCYIFEAVSICISFCLFLTNECQSSTALFQCSMIPSSAPLLRFFSGFSQMKSPATCKTVEVWFVCRNIVLGCLEESLSVAEFNWVWCFRNISMKLDFTVPCCLERSLVQLQFQFTKTRERGETKFWISAPCWLERSFVQLHIQSHNTTLPELHLCPADVSGHFIKLKICLLTWIFMTTDRRVRVLRRLRVDCLSVDHFLLSRRSWPGFNTIRRSQGGGDFNSVVTVEDLLVDDSSFIFRFRQRLPDILSFFLRQMLSLSPWCFKTT